MTGVKDRAVRDRRILYLQYTNPAAYPPLEHSSAILADAGWDVVFVGTGAFGASALLFEPRRNVKVVTHSFVAPGWRQKAAYLVFVLSVVRLVLEWRPRWVYASDVLSAPIALLLSFWPGIRIVYHEHDAPDMTGGGWSRMFSHWTRRHVARRAVGCVVPNDARAGLFEKETGVARVSCVWNCPSVSEVSPARESAWTGDDLWLLYHGSIVPSRLPEAVVHALALLPERVKLRVVGYETVGHAGYLNRLLTIARSLKVDGRVHSVGPVPTRRELLRWCSRSDVGLAFMPRETEDINERHMVGASNKPFDYLSQGLPLLVNSIDVWVREFVDPGFGLACDPSDASSIAGTVARFLADPRLMRSMGERGRQRIRATWNYETVFAPVLRILNDESPPGALAVPLNEPSTALPSSHAIRD
jgi:glycosyltransferase involved in cell wall biosynthesis